MSAAATQPATPNEPTREPHTLHLVEHASRLGGLPGLAAIADRVADLRAKHQDRHTVVLVGGDPARQDAQAAGLDAVIEPGPHGRLGRLRPVWRSVCARLDTPAQRIVVYDDETADRLRARKPKQPVELLELAPTPEDLDLQRIERAADAAQALRAVAGAAPASPLVGLAGDHPLYVDAFDPAMVMGLCCMAHHPQADPLDARMLVHPLQRRRRLADRLSEGVGRPGRMLQHPAAAAPWIAFPACDALILRQPCTLAWPWAEASGVPLVSAPSPQAHAAKARGANVRIVQADTPRLVAHALSHLLRFGPHAPQDTPTHATANPT